MKVYVFENVRLMHGFFATCISIAENQKEAENILFEEIGEQPVTFGEVEVFDTKITTGIVIDIF